MLVQLFQTVGLVYKKIIEMKNEKKKKKLKTKKDYRYGKVGNRYRCKDVVMHFWIENKM